MSSECATCAYNVANGAQSIGRSLQTDHSNPCPACDGYVHAWCLFPPKEGGKPTCRPCYEEGPSQTQGDSDPGPEMEDLTDTANEDSQHLREERSGCQDVEASVSSSVASTNKDKLTPSTAPPAKVYSRDESGRVSTTAVVGVSSPAGAHIRESGQIENPTSGVSTREREKMPPACLGLGVPPDAVCAAMGSTESGVPPTKEPVSPEDERVSELLRRHVCPGSPNAPRPGLGIDVASAEANRDDLEFIAHRKIYGACAASRQPQGAKCTLHTYNKRYPCGKKKDSAVILHVLQLKSEDRQDPRPPWMYAGVRSASTYVGPRQEKSIEAVILTVWLPKATNNTNKGVFVFMGVAHTGVQEFNVLMIKRAHSEGGYRDSAFELLKTPLLTFFTEFEEAKQENSAAWGGLQMLYEMMGLEEHDVNGVEHDVVSAIINHAQLAWGYELSRSDDCPSRAGAKNPPNSSPPPNTSPKMGKDIEVVNPYRGVQTGAQKKTGAIGCTTRGAGRRGAGKGASNPASPAGGEKKIIPLDSYIAIAGENLLQTAKDSLSKATTSVMKQETAALGKTMKANFLNEFKNTIKSQTKSLTETLVKSVKHALAAGDMPLKSGRSKGKKKTAAAGPAAADQRDESGRGDSENAEVAKLFNIQTAGIMKEVNTLIDAKDKEAEAQKKTIDNFKGEIEDLKRQVSELRQRYMDKDSRYKADTAARFESFERDLRGVIMEGAAGSTSGRTCTPAHARLHSVSQDSQPSIASNPSRAEPPWAAWGGPTRDVVGRHDPEQPKGRFVGSSYQPVGGVSTKRTWHGGAGESTHISELENAACALAEAKKRFEAAQVRTSERGLVGSFIDDSSHHRQKRRSMGDQGYDDSVWDGRRPAADIQSPQLTPRSCDRSGFGPYSGSAADGDCAYPSRVDNVNLARGGYPQGFDSSRSHSVDQTKHMRSGMAAAGPQENHARDPANAFADKSTANHNAWGENWHGREG